MIAERFTSLIDAFRKTMGHHVVRHDLYGPLLLLLYGRVQRMAQRLARLYERWKTGTLPKPRPSRAGQPRTRKPLPEGHLREPRRFAWALKLTGMPCALAHSRFRLLLNEQEMKDFLRDCPQAGRLLRPFAHMVGMRLDEFEATPLRPPLRPEPERAPKPPKPARPKKQSLRDLRRAFPGRHFPQFAKITP